VQYGYRPIDLLPKLPESKDAKFRFRPNFFHYTERRPVGFSLGPTVYGVALPHPDIFDPDSALAGAVKRMAAKLPTADEDLLQALKRFLTIDLEENFQPLSPDTDFSFETWIDSKNYPFARKQELRKVYERMPFGTLLQRMLKVNAFVKDEPLLEFKFARGIYARSDEFKVLLGPLIAEVEKQIYNHPAFIKHISVPDRPNYIMDILKILTTAGCTDATAYESTFVKRLMELIDHTRYDFFFKYVSKNFYRQIYTAMSGTNKIEFSAFMMEIEACRMSGEMNTSEANGYANYIVFKFLCWYHKYGSSRQVVEGDDGEGNTSSGKFPTKEQYAALGFNMKIELVQNMEEASFCGMIFDPEDQVNVTNPKEVLASFGWCSARYVKCKKSTQLALLRCKAMSYLYQYPGCPIVQELALYGLRVTRSYDILKILNKKNEISNWERDMYFRALRDETVKKTIKEESALYKIRKIIGQDEYEKKMAQLPIRAIPINTRILVEKMFQITIEQQIEIEAMLRKKNDTSELYLNLDWPKDWVEYDRLFVIRDHQETPTYVLNGGFHGIDYLPEAITVLPIENDNFRCGKLH